MIFESFEMEILGSGWWLTLELNQTDGGKCESGIINWGCVYVYTCAICVGLSSKRGIQPMIWVTWNWF